MSESNGQHSALRIPHSAFPISRREAVARLGSGFGGLALAALLGSGNRPALAAESGSRFDLAPRPPHFPPRAKAVIQLFMHGGPSHVDLFDPKPMLEKYDGQPPPAEVADDEKLTGNLLKSPYKFARHGQSGLELSETLPGLARHVDDIAIIRSMASATGPAVGCLPCSRALPSAAKACRCSICGPSQPGPTTWSAGDWICCLN
jgi:hypothetical protein